MGLKHPRKLEDFSMQTELTLQHNQTDVVTLIEKTNNMYESVLSALGLPVDGVLSTLQERKVALRNLPDIVEGIRQLDDSYYLSKFLVALSTGLFDAALSYLWDETIKQLRLRVINGDIQYFFDVVISDEKRSDFSTPEHLLKLDDATLVKGALDIDFISQIGYRHLDHIRYMRNRASAAHPNQAELTGLNLVSWLETCIKEIIATPTSSVQIRIGQLLRNIKTEIIDTHEAETMGEFFTELGTEKSDSLAKGLFGIYIDKISTQQTIGNINLVAPKLWGFVSEGVRAGFGTRCAMFIAHGEKHAAELSKRFLELVGGTPYLPDVVKTPEIKSAIDRLLEAHNGMNNFYTEPSLARQLMSIIGAHGTIPSQLNYTYIEAVVTVFITNGRGEAWAANSIYLDLIKKFDAKQAYLAITSFRTGTIKSRLQFSLCKTKFAEMLDLLEPIIVSQGVLCY